MFIPLSERNQTQKVTYVDSIYLKCSDSSIETESGLAVAKGWDDWEIGRDS